MGLCLLVHLISFVMYVYFVEILGNCMRLIKVLLVCY